ncbi:MAG TPA: gliding motility lipoprotein GldH [Prevotella sp.]|nr:gliding motility lipoprotein GldH [Prevotella sp.]
MRKLAFIPVLLLLLSSCMGRKVYDTYNHTFVSGWDKGEILSYDVPRVKTTGKYTTMLGLRVSDAYPFQSLTLIVEQTVYPKKTTRKDTLNCQIYDSQGTIRGNGISYFQYHYQISEMSLQAGDSIHVTVRHDMRREIVPGIADVGIEIAR